MSFAFAIQSKTELSNGETLTFSKRFLTQTNNIQSIGSPYSLPHLRRTSDNQSMDGSTQHNSGFDFANVGVIQPKLKVSQPNDAYEQEADRMAEQVTSTVDPSDSFELLMDAKDEGRTDRKCADCQMMEQANAKQGTEMRKKPSPLSRMETNDEVTNRINDTNSSEGSSLDLRTREFMESRFGYDFGNVRIHTSQEAAESAIRANALAYTMGNDIVFGEGYYRPDTMQGKRLLAHELTHVYNKVL